MSKKIILGIHVTNRAEEVPSLQSVLSEYCCHIRTRLGLHEVVEGACSPGGILIIETYGDEAGILEMERKIAEIPGVFVQKMVFEE
jgi:hypothetical protein